MEAINENMKNVAATDLLQEADTILGNVLAPVKYKKLITDEIDRARKIIGDVYQSLFKFDADYKELQRKYNELLASSKAAEVPIKNDDGPVIEVVEDGYIDEPDKLKEE